MNSFLLCLKCLPNIINVAKSFPAFAPVDRLDLVYIYGRLENNEKVNGKQDRATKTKEFFFNFCWAKKPPIRNSDPFL